MVEKPEISNSDLSINILKIYEPYFLMIPNYYQVFTELINNIIYKDNDSSFSLQYKLFYGLMASSTVGCEYLLYDFEKSFLDIGGDKSWIEEGLKCKNIPEQIRGMATINNLLAHKPWSMVWGHFSEFKNGLSVFLFQSAIILTSVQRLASIISSLNSLIQKNIEDEKKGKNFEKLKDDQKTKDEKNNKDELAKKKKRQKSDNLEDEIEKVIISVKKNYKKNKNKKEEETKDKEIKNIKDIFKKYISEFIVSYNNFNPHMEKYLLEEDFNWKTNAKYFYFDYAGKEMDYLDKELKLLENLALENEDDNNKGINLFKLRNDIEKYIGVIFGITDDEYYYHQINESLSIELKRVIKKIACYPDQILEQELESCLEILTKEQLVYLIFIVTSIKQKISLTFFAKAFDDFISINKSLKNNNIDN